MYEINYIDRRNNKIKIAESGQLAVGICYPPRRLQIYFIVAKNADQPALTACMGREGLCEKVGSRVKWANGYN